jgi:GNAT superfamily N-acetyltransferase
MKPQDLYRLVSRPALPKDTRQVMELTARIWDGDDYVPYVWQEWLEDPDGILIVAEYGRRVVGLAKLAQFTHTDWWMQGLRVDVDHRGRGIARHLHEYILQYWLRHGSGVLRLSTSSKNSPVHHLCKESGMHQVGDMIAFGSASMPEPLSGWSRLGEEEAAAALAYARQSPVVQRAGGRIDFVWAWVDLNLENLARIIREGHAWRREEDGALLVAAVDDEDGRQAYLQLLACDMEALPGCLLAFRRMAAQMGMEKVRWLAPVDAEVQSDLAKAGYTTHWESSLFLFERGHPDG